jgi:hypothetical protein
VATLWGFSKEQEEDLLGHVAARCQVQPLPEKEIEVDEFQYHYSQYEPPHMLNDIITINRIQGADHQVRPHPCTPCPLLDCVCCAPAYVLWLCNPPLPTAPAGTGVCHPPCFQVCLYFCMLCLGFARHLPLSSDYCADAQLQRCTWRQPWQRQQLCAPAPLPPAIAVSSSSGR